MTNILWVEASPKGDRSTSTAAAKAYLEARREADPDLVVTLLNVWERDLVPFGREAALAKLEPFFGVDHTDEQAVIWAAVVAEIEHVRGHDELLVSSPMWNWSIPYALKHWIDVITQPLLSFTVDAEGRHIGALGEGKPVQLVLTRSSPYDGSHPELEDFQRPYLEYLFEMLGYGEIRSLVIEPTTRWTAEERAEVWADAIAAGRNEGLLR